MCATTACDEQESTGQRQRNQLDVGFGLDGRKGHRGRHLDETTNAAVNARQGYKEKKVGQRRVPGEGSPPQP